MPAGTPNMLSKAAQQAVESLQRKRRRVAGGQGARLMKLPRLLPASLAAVTSAGGCCRRRPRGSRYPLPDFTEHTVPDTQNPAPTPAYREYLDLAFLLAALSLASYFAW